MFGDARSRTHPYCPAFDVLMSHSLRYAISDLVPITAPSLNLLIVVAENRSVQSETARCCSILGLSLTIAAVETSPRLAESSLALLNPRLSPDR